MSRGGRRHGRPHAPVESCHSLSAWGYFQFAQMWADDDAQDSFEWEIDEQSVVIRFTRDGSEHEQKIALTFTPCRFGGRRQWIICYCGRRVGKVYLPCQMYNGGVRVARFRCRFCYDLTYAQRQERRHGWTYDKRIERIEERWLGPITKNWIFKRKGQHWSTFNRWCEKREALVEKSNQTWLGCSYMQKLIAQMKLNGRSL